MNALIPISDGATPREAPADTTPREPAPAIPYRLDGSRMFDPRPIFPGWRLQ